jgi:hypothetical protein
MATHVFKSLEAVTNAFLYSEPDFGERKQMRSYILFFLRSSSRRFAKDSTHLL